MQKNTLIQVLKEILEVYKDYSPEHVISKRCLRKIDQLEHEENHIDISENDFFWTGPDSIDDSPCNEELKNRLREAISNYNA